MKTPAPPRDPRPRRAKSVTFFNVQRLTLWPETLAIEARDPITGIWRPTRQIFYDEVDALYAYRELDWGYIGVAWIYAAIGALAVWLPLGLSGASTRSWAAALGMLGLLLLFFTAYRVFIVQRPMLLLVTSAGPARFPLRDRAFTEALVARLPLLTGGLPEAAAEPAAAPTPDGVLAEPPPAIAAPPPVPPAGEVPPPPPADRWAWRPEDEGPEGAA